MKFKTAVRGLGAIVQPDGSLNNNLPRILYRYGERTIQLQGVFDLDILDAISSYARGVFNSENREVSATNTDQSLVTDSEQTDSPPETQRS